MNKCFLFGKIISDINFKFIINSKNISIAMFDLELENKSIVKIKAYNEIADYCYSHLLRNCRIMIYGNIQTTGEIEIRDINILYKNS